MPSCQHVVNVPPGCSLKLQCVLSKCTHCPPDSAGWRAVRACGCVPRLYANLPHELLLCHPIRAQAGGLRGQVGVYHGDCTPGERRRVHHAFLRDELQVLGLVGWGFSECCGRVPAGLAFGLPTLLAHCTPPLLPTGGVRHYCLWHGDR